MAHGAFQTVGGMRAGFPLSYTTLWQLETVSPAGISRWKICVLDPLSNGWFGRNSQNQKNEQGETEHARTENYSRQTS